MRKLYLETFLIAFAVILLEISYTRVFSYKLVYYFTYLIIGLSLLGLGAGGVFVAVFERLRREPAERLVYACVAVAALSVLGGYLFIAEVPLRLFRMVVEIAQRDPQAVGLVVWESAKLSAVIAVLVLPFLCAGIALARIFASDTDDIGRLYFVDLLGAALGCVVIVPGMTYLSPPGVVFLAGFAFALAALRIGFRRGGSALAAPAALCAVLALGGLFSGWLPDPVRDPVKGDEKSGRAVFSRWSPVFRVDLVPVPGAVDPPVYALVHDGMIGSSIIGWDGDVASLGRYEQDDRSYPFRLLDEGARVAIIGSAGGNEILASLKFGASRVTGIELNPVTVSLVTDLYADFVARMADDPRVEIVNAEGRSYLERSGETYDLVWLVAPDSYAAMNAATAGAFVLSESYLYTREMIRAALDHLDEDGILCAQFGEIDFDVKPNRTLRYLGTARAALRELGVTDFRRHVLVAVAPAYGRLSSATILVKKTPFSEKDAEHFREAVSAVDGGRVVYALGAEGEPRAIAQVIELPESGLARFFASYPYRVGPIEDDSPFFWHFVGFDDVLFGGRGAREVNVEEGLGERMLLVFLAFGTAFAAALLLLPFVAIHEVWAQIEHKTSAALYFAALGLGFMFLEVALIQKLTLFLGYPTYSLTVTLFALLLSTGLGSLLSERYRGSRTRILGGLLAAVALILAGYQAALPALVEVGVGWPFPLRVAATVALLVPLGLCLGAFLPLGLRSVSQSSEHGDVLVAWCWAVNGFFSVVASVLSTILSMTFGFQAVLYLGLAIYAAGVLAFRRVPEPRPA